MGRLSACLQLGQLGIPNPTYSLTNFTGIFILGPFQTVLRNYSWLYTQGSLHRDLGNCMWCWRWSSTHCPILLALTSDFIRTFRFIYVISFIIRYIKRDDKQILQSGLFVPYYVRPGSWSLGLIFGFFWTTPGDTKRLLNSLGQFFFF